MSTDDMANVTPTVAVGIGQAGCSMISRLYELTQEEGITEKFRFIGIDANTRDLQTTIDTTADAVEYVELNAPEQWETNKHEYHFLDDELLPGGQSQLEKPGALRQRRIGRYYVDSQRNFAELRTRLESLIENFVDYLDRNVDREAHAMNIWIMNSLGGGTGSGSFPIISAMIGEITENTEWTSGKFYIGGVAALPNVDDIEDQHSTFQLNTYAALKDIRVLLGEDENADTELQLGEERPGVRANDRYELDKVLFNRYFLHPFDPDEMTSRSYKYQLNKSSASIPLYFALVPAQENWPDDMQEYEYSNLYTFDTYEVSAPAENMYRYFATQGRLDSLESDLVELNAEKDRVTSDLMLVEDIKQLNISQLIEDYCVEHEKAEDDVEMTQIVPEKVDLPERVRTDMVETAKSVVAGLTPTIDEVDDRVENRYNREWDDTETDDLDNRNVFKYAFYQMVIRHAMEQRHNHELHEQVNSKWEKYKDELPDNLSFLDAKDAPQKWQDGLKQFLDEKITEAEQELPTGALFAGGLSGGVMVLLIIALLQNLPIIETLGERSVALAALSLSWAWIVIGIAFITMVVLFGYYLYEYSELSSLRKERDDCADKFSEYQSIERTEKEIEDRLERLDFGKGKLERRKEVLEDDISTKEELLEIQTSFKQDIEERLEKYEFEFDRKMPLPIRDADKLTMTGVKNKIRKYIQSHPSINLQIGNEEIFDTEADLKIQETETGDEEPESIGWFETSGLIEEADIAQAMKEILDEERRLARCPLSHRHNETQEREEEILQYIWNPANDSITEARGGDIQYVNLVGGYDTSQENAVISDEFRVWMMGVYTNFYLENFGLYADLDEWYTGSEGDLKVANELGIPADADLITRRFAYPEFYTAHDHPLQDNIKGYPK